MAQMEPLAELMPNGTHCIDLPGHGCLVGDDPPLSIEKMAEVVLATLTGPTHLIGYSMGGYVALHLAANHPEHVRSVVTLATKFHWTPEGAQQEARMLNAEKVREKVPAFGKMLEDRHGNYWPRVMERTAALMLALGSAPLLTAAVLAKVKCPVLLLRGSEDNMVSEAETRWAQSCMTDSRYFELAGQPHPLEKVDMQALVKAILE